MDAQGAAAAGDLPAGEQPVTFLPLMQRFVVLAGADWGVALWDLATRQLIERDLGLQQMLAACAAPTVPVLSGAPVADLRRMVEENLPFVDCDAAAGWGALQWSLETLAEGPTGDTSVPVTFPSGRRGEGRRFAACDRTRDFPLRQFVRSFGGLAAEAERSGALPPYLRAWAFERAGHPELRGCYTPPEWAGDWFERLRPEQRPHYRWLFIGPAGAHTPLHIDPCLTHAWLTQIEGVKRWLLVPPADVSLVVDGEGFADLDAPDAARFPRAAEARRIELVLTPGQTIFIPQGWAHQVTSLSPGVSLTHNFLAKRGFGLVRLACLRRMLAAAPRAAAASERAGCEPAQPAAHR
eukprot:TRINITY_DN19075_c0_g1_i1.p1 TRINITY_DN19075_c0_g1~~TRINITY_DN19075_c0_g1_i1.p1  ORF type:complete len:377 (+),score=126.11 TRINITY_DN19075_c0_g1_i1:77-1132(+)